MKLLIATGIYPPTVGGPATYSKLLADELPARGHTVRVVSFDTVRHLPAGLRHAWYACKLIQHVGWADLVYAQDPVSVGYPAMIIAKLLRKPLVVKIVGDFAWEQGVQRFGVKDLLDVFVAQGASYVSPVMRLKRIQTKVAQYANRIIVPSEYLKRIVCAWGIESSKIHVVYNAFEKSVVDVPQYREARAMHNIKGTVIVTAGRLVPWKGIVTLVSLMPELKKTFEDVHLYIAGDGPERKIIEQYVQREQLHSCVTMLGALPQQELFTYVRAADVFVLNTAYEGFSHQLLETLALETPVVTTNVGGNPELIHDGKNGLLVSFDDTEALLQVIARVFHNKAEAQTFARSGAESVEQFTTDRLLRETEHVLQDVTQHIT